MIDRKKIADALREIASFYAPDPDCTNSIYDSLTDIADELDPPEARPLLADAQVGWLCKLRNGEWRQIKGFGDSWGTNDCLNPNLFTVFLTDGTTRNIYGTYLGTTANPLPNDIIATEPLAEEGTGEWAWQMLILQKPVSHPAEGIWRDTYYSKDGFVRCMAKTGWQLYKEPKPETAKEQFAVGDWVERRESKEQIKSLLADAKVGDLCKRRDGRFVSLSNVPPDSLYWEVGNNLYYQDGRESRYEERDVDIVYTEPLAPEGSAEWAVQRMKLGDMVCNSVQEFVGYWSIVNGYCFHAHSGHRCSPEKFLSLVNVKTGWQLYTEPKPKPKPEHPAINGYNRYDYIPVEGIRQPKPEPEPALKVGDWVEYRLDSRIYYGEINDIRDHAYYLSFTTEDIPPDQARAIRLENIARKLKPSEVVLDFGNGIKGRVCMPYPERGLSVLNDNNHWIAQIDPDALDAPMRKLVKALLKAQGGAE